MLAKRDGGDSSKEVVGLADLDAESLGLLGILRDRQGGVDEVTLCQSAGVELLRGRTLLRSLEGQELVFSTKTIASPFPIYILTPYGAQVLTSQGGES